MDLGVIIAIVGTGISMVAAILAMMFWMRGESNDVRNEQKEDRKDFMQMSRSIENLVRAIQDEMKDFHHRLLEIERERK